MPPAIRQAPVRSACAPLSCLLETMRHCPEAQKKLPAPSLHGAVSEQGQQCTAKGVHARQPARFMPGRKVLRPPVTAQLRSPERPRPCAVLIAGHPVPGTSGSGPAGTMPAGLMCPVAFEIVMADVLEIHGLCNAFQPV